MKFLALYLIFRLPAAFIMDCILGDPEFLGHPVILMGKAVSKWELFFRSRFPADSKGEFLAGMCLFFAVSLASFFIPLLLILTLFLAADVLSNPVPLILACAVDLWLGYRCLACRSLSDEACNVAKKLSVSLEEGRKAVARIVGRDVNRLDREHVIKACIETVSENTTDGIVSPMLYFALGGAPLCLFFKAVSTMDSMIGYKNERYRHFGTFAAKADDALNFLPARMTAFVMLFSALIMNILKPFLRRLLRAEDFHFFIRNGLEVYIRDKGRHASPNAAHSESVCAGLLGVRLAGDAFYEGKLERKPFLGNSIREVSTEDIYRTIKLMWLTSFVFAAALSLILLFSIPLKF